jgi:hypothetical protein
MPFDLPSIASASAEPGDAPGELAARVAAGPGFWTGWLAELDRQGLLEDLLADDVIARALRESPTGHKYDRVLGAKMTVICVLVSCLFPGDGYDAVLAKAFGLPGLRLRPGVQAPAGSAFSQARKLLGEQAMRKIFELDAERADADLGITALWKGLEVTALDGTTMELARNDALACEFGTPADRARPLLRIAAHVRTATRRWIGAGIGSYHDGENGLADKLEWSFTPGMLNLADRGFFSMDRFLRFSAAGAHLAWRVKNSAKSVPARTVPGTARRLRAGHAPRVRRHAHPAPPRDRRQGRAAAAGHHGTARHLHRHRPDPQRPGEDHADPRADHPARPRDVPGPRDRGAVFRTMAGRDRVLAPQENHPRAPPSPARPVPGPGPAGSLGAPAHPQHHRHRHCPRRRRNRDRSPAHPVHCRPRPRPRARRR